MAPLSSDTLRDADGLIHGERQAGYGSWEQNFGDLAVVWNMYLTRRGLLGTNAQLEPSDCTFLFVLAKDVRQMHAHKRDNLVDAAGYLAITDALTSDDPDVEALNRAVRKRGPNGKRS